MAEIETSPLAFRHAHHTVTIRDEVDSSFYYRVNYSFCQYFNDTGRGDRVAHRNNLVVL